MTLTITRVEPGVYSTTINGDPYRIVAISRGGWCAEKGTQVIARGKTKKEVVSRLQSLARLTADRRTEDHLKIPNRTLIEKGTKLTVDGIRGRCEFVRYVEHASGAQWLDILTSRGFSRTVRPEAVKTVHRSKR